ncbi:MAG: menaquinone biosynthesis decarboxylase [Deltaproteobacteria bacterium]|nr:menaquinone biosynthesis decarboxylase [Deltaproteobacteria bacterium]
MERLRYDGLGDFIDQLDQLGELVRIEREVDPRLEITEIADRCMKAPGGGPALLFERVRGSGFPLAVNLMGSRRRMSLALGVQDIDEHANELLDLLRTEPGSTLWEKLKALPKLARLASMLPKSIPSGAPCQEVVEDSPDLTNLPIATCWPGDGGPFITLGQVITRDPDNGHRNVGLYRMQLLGKNTTAMHWQVHKTGHRHYRRYKELKRRIPVAVALGGDPALIYAATAPMPDGVDEYLLAGFLRRRPVKLVRCKTNDLEVPADADFVLEGYVDPEEPLVDEGPFGDHTGYYTPKDRFPAFHVTCVTRRKSPVYPHTIVGPPPMEDAWIGKATERLFLPLLKMTFPEIVDMNLPVEGAFHNLALLSIRKEYPAHARKIAHSLWGTGQLMFTKCVIVVDEDVDVQNPAEVAWRVLANLDPRRDLFFSEGPTDQLDHAPATPCISSKVGIDATKKWPEEGYAREWPEIARMSPDIQARIDRTWPELGIRLPGTALASGRPFPRGKR